MKYRFITITLAMVFAIGLFSPDCAAKKDKKKTTKTAKKGKQKTTPLKEPKGGWEKLGPTGILAVQEAKSGLTVQGTVPGSPADGVLNKGDVIVKIEGQSLGKKGYGKQLTKVVNESEAGKNAGKLSLTLKDGKVVALKLPQLGSYSPTAPYNCPKTDKIVTMAADAMAKTIVGKNDKKNKTKVGSSATQVEILGLMATGEKKYIDVVAKKMEGFKTIGYDGRSLQARRKDQAKESGKAGGRVGSWSTAYATIAMAEYYYLTKDESILPALKTYTLSLVEGQDPAGLYGHKMKSLETNRAPGYGQMNQTSLACYLGMLLAKKAGVNVPGLNKALGLSRAYVEYHINKGGFPYGFHGPRNFDFNNNGTSGLAAVIMALEGNKEGARFFASMAAADPKLGQGHASSLFSTYWTPAGVNVGGPKLTKKVFPAVVNYLTPRRLWDGSFVKGYSEGKIGGVALLAYCLPRKALLITGREADESIWFDEKEADAACNMSKLNEGKSPEELLSLFGHENPVVRTNSIGKIKGMIGQDAKSLKKASKGKQESKKAKARAANKKAGEKAVAALFPKLQEIVSSGTPHEKASALQCYLFVCPEGDLKNRLKTIATILRKTKESDEVRVEATTALASHPELIKPYYEDILKFLVEERPSDRFAEIDADIAGKALNPIHKSVEWNTYKAGLVKDKGLYYKAAIRLMKHKRQHPRGTGVRMLAHVPSEDLPLVINELDHILKDDDRTYHSYHSARTAKEPAANIYVDHNILEGVDYIVENILGGDGKSAFKLMTLMKTLPGYGIHAQRVVPKVKENHWVKTSYAQGEKGRFYKGLEEMFKKIENATDGPKLISVEEIKKKAKK